MINFRRTPNWRALKYFFLGILSIFLFHLDFVYAAEMEAAPSSSHPPSLYNFDTSYGTNSEKTSQLSLGLGWIKNPFQFSGAPFSWESEAQYSYSIDVDYFEGKTSEREFQGLRTFAAYWQKLNANVFFQLGLGLHYLKGIETTPVVAGQFGYRINPKTRLSARLSDDFAYSVGFQPGATRAALKRTVFEVSFQWDPLKILKFPIKLKQAQFSDTNRMSTVNLQAMGALLKRQHQVWLGGRYFYEGAKISSYTSNLGYFSPIKWTKFSLEVEASFKLAQNWSLNSNLAVGKAAQISNPSSRDYSADLGITYGSVSTQQINLLGSYRNYDRDVNKFEERKIIASWVRRF